MERTSPINSGPNFASNPQCSDNIISDNTTIVEQPALSIEREDENGETPPHSDNIIIVGKPAPSIQREDENRETPPLLSPPTFQELIKFFPLDLRNIGEVAKFCSQLNEAIQKEPCFSLEEYSVRILQLEQMHTAVSQLEYYWKLRDVLEQHLIHAKNAAQQHFLDSTTSVQDSMWMLYERILKLPTLEPDLFGAAVATLTSKLSLDSALNSRLLKKVKWLLGFLLPPCHFFLEHKDAYSALRELEKMKYRTSNLQYRLENASEPFERQLSAPMKSIDTTYRSFLEEYREASAQHKEELCKPKARLSGFGFGFFLISQGCGHELLCRAFDGKLVKRNGQGTHPVYHNPTPSVFFKHAPNEKYPPIRPAMEFAVYAFYQLLGRQEGVAQTAVVKIHLNADSHEVLQAGYGIDGISLQALLEMVRVPSFLESCLGKQKATQMFEELLEWKWHEDFLQKHPTLSESTLALMTRQECIELFINKLRKPLDLGQRFSEFKELPEDDETYRLHSVFKTIWDKFAKHTEKHSTELLVGALALLDYCPDLFTEDKGNGKPTSLFEDLTVLYDSLKSIKHHFSEVPAQDLFQEIPDWMKRINASDFSAHFVFTLLMNPGDHRAENLYVTIDRNENKGVNSLSLSLELITILSLSTLKSRLYGPCSICLMNR